MMRCNGMFVSLWLKQRWRFASRQVSQSAGLLFPPSNCIHIHFTPSTFCSQLVSSHSQGCVCVLSEDCVHSGDIGTRKAFFSFVRESKDSTKLVQVESSVLLQVVLWHNFYLYKFLFLIFFFQKWNPTGSLLRRRSGFTQSTISSCSENRQEKKSKNLKNNSQSVLEKLFIVSFG